MALSLGEPNFVSRSELHDYCESGRRLIRPLAFELEMAGLELKGALKEIPNVPNVRWRARVVASHLDRAAGGIQVACVELVRTFMSFERNFIHYDVEKSKKYFDIHK
jgi:hypothetical protein